MNPQTNSVNSNAWAGQIVFSYAFGYESSLTVSHLSIGQQYILGSIRPDTMLASEKALAKDWDSPEEDSAWASL